MRTRGNYCSLSVCVFPAYWLHVRFVLKNEYTKRIRASFPRFSTLEFIYKIVSFGTYSSIRLCSVQVGHFFFLEIYNTVQCVHAVLNIACLTLLKIAIGIISYIEHTHQHDRAASIQRGSDCRLTPFRTLVWTTYMLPFSENVLCIEIKPILKPSLLSSYRVYAFAWFCQPAPLAQYGLHWIHEPGGLT